MPKQIQALDHSAKARRTLDANCLARWLIVHRRMAVMPFHLGSEGSSRIALALSLPGWSDQRIPSALHCFGGGSIHSDPVGQ
jgi:hypothetical protein